MARRVMVMAGGTGGHVFPALATARELARRGVEVCWLGVPDSFEARLVPEHGFELELVPVRKLRGQGLAAQLIRASVASVEGTVWLLCHPDLEGFYQRLGFTQDTLLPQSLSERLVRYKRNKPMIAMGLEPLVRSSFNKV